MKQSETIPQTLEGMQESEQAVPAEGLGLDSLEPVDYPLPGLEGTLKSGDHPNSRFPDKPPSRLWQKEMDDLRDHRMAGHAM